MFKPGDRLRVKPNVTAEMLKGIGFNYTAQKAILGGAMEFESDDYYGDYDSYGVTVLGYAGDCWIWKDWIQPKQEQLTFVFKE